MSLAAQKKGKGMDTLIPSLSAVGRPKYLDRYISNSKGTNLADEEFS